MIEIRPQLIAALKRDEGLRLKAYPDPLSGGEPWTIGYGHTGGIKRGDVWTQAQCDAALISDARKHTEELVAKAPWIAGLDPVRQDVLFNMAFNLGVVGLLKWKNTLNLVKTGQYKAAASAMRKSLWARQVGARATRLALQMERGVL